MKITFLAIIFALPCLGQTVRWYKGNTHAHTTLCGHADSPPSTVAQWYHDHGYNFAILSEHNKFIDPKTVKLKGEIREDFLLLPWRRGDWSQDGTQHGHECEPPRALAL